MPLKLKNKSLNYVLTPNRIIVFLAGFAVLLILVYLGSYVGRVLKKPSLSLSSPVAVTKEGEAIYRTDANFIELVGNAEIGSKLTINAQELKLNNFEKFTKEFQLENGLNVFTLKTENQFGRTTTIVLTITKEETIPTSSPTPTPTPLMMNISIEIIKKDTNVIVKIDEEQKTDRLYKVGSTLEFTATKSFDLIPANTSSILLKINGVSEIVSTSNSWAIINAELVRK